MAWWDINKALSYDCLFNFIIGNRSSGKSYGSKKFVVNRYLKTGEMFIYLRRYQDELKATAEDYFNDTIFNHEFDGHEITYENGTYFCDGEVMGYAMALTKAKDYKSIAFPNVWWIIFEEFLIEDNGFSRYLKNEVEQFLNFYMSIDRYRGTKVLFLANAVKLINPYTLYFDLQLPYGSNFLRKDDILLQLVQDAQFIEERKQTRFGKLIAGTEYEKYAIGNEFKDNIKTFVMKKSGNAKYFFTFTYKGEGYGVWADYQDGKLYISNDVDASCRIVYALTNDDHAPNTMLIKSYKTNPHFKVLLQNYEMGNVYFESVKLKSITFEAVKLLSM